jgi:hypothetical protein
MRSLLVVLLDPLINVLLKLIDGRVDLLTECDLAELIQYCLLEALVDPIALGRFRLRLGMIDVLHGQIPLIFMILAVSAVPSTSVREDSQHLNAMLLEEGKNPIVEQIGGYGGVLPVIQLHEAKHEAKFAVGIDERLLLDAPNTFYIADEEGVLDSQILRMLGFDLSISFSLFYGLFQSRQLFFCKDPVFLNHLFFQGFRALFEGL